jgi:4-hydroxy-3-methylbut-2-enyl diphosphate reductase
VDNAHEVNSAWLEGAATVAVTAGASAPEVLVEELVDWLKQHFGFGTLEEVELKEEDVRFQLPGGLEQSAIRLTQISQPELRA